LIAGAERSSSTAATAMTPTPNKMSAINVSTGAILGVGGALKQCQRPKPASTISTFSCDNRPRSLARVTVAFHTDRRFSSKAVPVSLMMLAADGAAEPP
jgi:hypothetical protein